MSLATKDRGGRSLGHVLTHPGQRQAASASTRSALDPSPHPASKYSLSPSGCWAPQEGTLPFHLVGHALWGHPGPRRQLSSGRGEQGLGEALSTAEGKAPPWLLPNPSDMGTHCSRNRMTINRKNLLSQRCQACHRVSAGGAASSAGSRNAPFSPLADTLMFSQVEGENSYGQRLPPVVRKLCPSNKASPQSHGPRD